MSLLISSKIELTDVIGYTICNFTGREAYGKFNHW